jgi:hypothetical protein
MLLIGRGKRNVSGKMLALFFLRIVWMPVSRTSQKFIKCGIRHSLFASSHFPSVPNGKWQLEIEKCYWRVTLD